MENGLVKKLKDPQLAKKFPTSYGTRKFIVAFARSRHLSLSCARSIQSIPPSPIPLYEDTFLYLSSRLLLCIPSGLFPSGSPTKTLYAPYHLTSPHVDLNLADFTTVRLTTPSYCNRMSRHWDFGSQESNPWSLR